MPKYEIRHNDGDTVTIEAENEAEARELAMIKKWGSHPSRHSIVPNAKFWGFGLIVHETR